MGNEEEKQEDEPLWKKDLTAEEEDQPLWNAGMEEGKQIMKACLKAADEVWRDHYANKVEGFGLPANIAKVPEIGQENIANVAIAMYNSIVMMEMERGRMDALKGNILIHGPDALVRGRN